MKMLLACRRPINTGATFKPSAHTLVSTKFSRQALIEQLADELATVLRS